LNSLERALPPQDHAGFWRGLRTLFGLLPAPRRRQFFLVLLLMVIGGFAELATIGAVVPFLSLLAQPESLSRFPALATILDWLAASTGGNRLAAATAAFAILAVLAAAARLQLAWSTQNFTYGAGHELAVEVQRRVLLQPYAYHVNQNSSTILASLGKVQVLVYVIQQVMLAGTALFMSTVIAAAVLFVDPFAALVGAAGFCLVYALVPTVTRRRLAANSAVLGESYDERLKIVQESLGGIRDVIIDNSQSVYLDAFRRVDARVSAAGASTAFISAAPRFVIEALGMVLIAAIAVLLSSREGGFASALPILGALALGAQRVLPLLQQLHVSRTVIEGNAATFHQVLDLLRLPADDELPTAETVRPLPFRDRISIENLSFSYPGRHQPAIENISLDIARGSSVALIGKTGSGKSTLVDLLMGLLDPTSGRILVDGVPLTRGNRRQWQRSIAHVPQAIFLSDDSIIRNIAFGIPTNAIDLERAIEASKKAQLHDFVLSLPDGYETHVGERGVRLSGGQRQRLGIARAIYKQAPVLVFDEATSALDDSTEKAVMGALEKLGEEGRTVILIAHRLSTVALADLVIRLENGRLVEQGSYEEVVGRARPRVARPNRTR
jgi:ABC-type multidrug transport system fused ATPase/permease subunit